MIFQCTVTLVKNYRSLEEAGRKIEYKFGIVAEFFLKEIWPSLLSWGSGTVNQLKSENWLRDYESLFWWFQLDLYSLDIELSHLHRLSTNLVDCPSISLLGTPWSTSWYYISAQVKTILINALTLLSIMVTTLTLSVVIKSHHMAPATPGLNYPHCI